ncbi:glutathione S-transferase N-terminal domain-containing protein [Pseudomonas fluorescens]|uniref:glutathione S-transferase N-terminal domain-containing protein n=1 Tax=Pseudomonas fluorescens TaxID=294 RepID=UPI003F973284
MKLLYSPGSPFARKVRVLLREKKLLHEIQEEVVNPHENGQELLGLNPLAKVPALAIEGGSYFDSPLICEYLDSLSADFPMIPTAVNERLHVLRLQALADGIMDAAVASVLESRRPDVEPSQHWLRRWEAAIRRAIASLATSELTTEVRLDGIAVACALAYITFRLPLIAWREEHPNLAAWLDAYSDRQSFSETKPPVG